MEGKFLICVVCVISAGFASKYMCEVVKYYINFIILLSVIGRMPCITMDCPVYLLHMIDVEKAKNLP